MAGRYHSKPLVHFFYGGTDTACGVQAHKPRYVDGNYPSTTGAWTEVTCGSCKRTAAWKQARAKQ